MLSKTHFLLTLFCLWGALVVADNDDADEGKATNGVKKVTYDGRSIIINGKREIFFSGSIHYPRATPDMWPKLLDSAKEGGINVIQTYVFWNLHEPVEGQYNFEGRADLVKFIKLIQEKGLYATLRVGPFIQAEWNHGGFPYWLRDVQDITFRTNNEPYKHYMKKFITMIIKKMTDEKLFGPQGGPIILAQIENEYTTIQAAYKADGLKYVQWAAQLAMSFNLGIPWVMCKQKEVPKEIINTCNGRNCGDTFTGPNHPNQPSLWTENWTAQFRVYGDGPSQRSAEDLAYAVALFFSKNGTLVNYYMYFGGTNFGRTGANFVTTRYYDEAPLDEFALKKDPKWSHLRDLHAALRLCKKGLLFGTPSTKKLNHNVEIRVFERAGENTCVAFLINSHKKTPATVNFKGQDYFVPRYSISILPDCKTVVFNTQTVVSQHNARGFVVSKKSNKGFKWEMFQEKPPTIDQSPIKNKKPLQHYSTAKDTSDYVWYTARIDLDPEDLPRRSDIFPVIQVASLGQALSVFVNGEHTGDAHGNHIEHSFTYRKPVPLKLGLNDIQLMSVSVGLPDSGAYLEHRMSGVHAVSLQGLNTGTLDISNNGWGHRTGMEGEMEEIYTEEGIKKVQWTSYEKGGGKPLTWYKTYFDAPEGNNPVTLNLTGMSKGMAFVNGINIGRYWVSYLSPLGKPTQSEYHVPRSFLKATDNLLVLFEELHAKPEQIKVLTVNRDTICSFITEYHTPNVNAWRKQENKLLTVADDVNVKAHLRCPGGKAIAKVQFASFGNPTGACGDFILGNCTVPSTKKIVEDNCLGKSECAVPIQPTSFHKPNEDPCPGVAKTLAIQVKCSKTK